MTTTLDVTAGSVPPANGDWWVTSQAVPHQCRVCGEITRDAPAMMAYIPTRDPHGWAARKYPGWAECGWLVWWECQLCGADYPRSCDTRTTDQVRALGIDAGTWSRLI